MVLAADVFSDLGVVVLVVVIGGILFLFGRPRPK